LAYVPITVGGTESRAARWHFPAARLLAAAAALAVGLHLTGAAEPGSRPDGDEPEILLTVRFVGDGRPIYVPVTYRGKSYQFILDTGSTWCVFDEALKPPDTRPASLTKVMTPAGPREVGTYRCPPAMMGKIDLSAGGTAIFMDLSLLREETGDDIRGVVGMSALRKYCLGMDFDRGVLAVFASPAQAPPAWGAAFPLRFSRQGLPLVTASMPADIECPFLIDTGQTATGCLNEALFDYLVEARDLPTTTQRVATADGVTTMRAARVPHVSVGRFRVEDAVIGQSVNQSLGLWWLRRFRTTLDFANGRIYLTRGKRFGRRDEVNMCGLLTVRRDGKLLVDAVWKGSSADKAGIRPGDEIVRVNGRPASAVSQWELGNLQRGGPGKVLKFVLKREGRTIRAEATLKRRL
jgi:hypothetical protein